MTRFTEHEVEHLDQHRIGGMVDIDIRDAVDRFDLVERECETRCSSGNPFEGRWRGISIGDLLTDVEPETTHLVVESSDGFRVCIDVTDSLEGILAVSRLDSTASSGLPRFVCPGLLGTRMVKNVARIESRQLDRGDDPRDLENLDLDSEK